MQQKGTSRQLMKTLSSWTLIKTMYKLKMMEMIKLFRMNSKQKLIIMMINN